MPGHHTEAAVTSRATVRRSGRDEQAQAHLEQERFAWL